MSILLAFVLLYLLWAPVPYRDPLRIIATILIVLAVVGVLYGYSNPGACASHRYFC